MTRTSDGLDGAKSTKYKCKICGKEFNAPSALGGHTNIVHTNPGKIRPKKCAITRMKEDGTWEATHKKWMEKREAHRNNIKLTDKQKQLILGGILGDASIRKGNPRSINARVTFTHSIKQYEYCMWKYEILKPIVKTQPKIENNGGYGDKVIRFNTTSLPCLTEIHDMVKRNGETTVTPEHLLMIQSPLALAVWAMDDGTIGGKLFRFSLGNRSQEEAKLLQTWMQTKWDIESHIYEAGRELVLSITKQREAKKLKELIDPWLIDSMKYKTLYTI